MEFVVPNVHRLLFNKKRSYGRNLRITTLKIGESPHCFDSKQYKNTKQGNFKFIGAFSESFDHSLKVLSTNHDDGCHIFNYSLFFSFPNLFANLTNI